MIVSPSLLPSLFLKTGRILKIPLFNILPVFKKREKTFTIPISEKAILHAQSG